MESVTSQAAAVAAVMESKSRSSGFRVRLRFNKFSGP